jgi:hypothetical protein
VLICLTHGLQILKSLAEVVKAQNATMDAYCVSNGIRPLLSYGAKGTRVGRKTFLFVSALKQWESLHHLMDLTEAYKRAKASFKGKMEQLFVVLKENQPIPLTGSNNVPLSNKRPAEEKLANDPKRNLN